MLTIKELYQIAVERDYEDAIVGIDVEDINFIDEDGVHYCYCEDVALDDIAFGDYYENGKPSRKALWLHPKEEI